jgi:hypothetical protein
MRPSTRDRISVDLRGLKTSLLDRAQALGVSPSGLVRTTLAEALGQPSKINIERHAPPPPRGRGDRVRLCLRMSRKHARAALEASGRAGLNPGDYIGGLVTQVPVLSAGGSRAEHLATLVASSAELSTLSRNIHRLTALLRQANVEPARPYREMLDTVADDVRRHLELAARVLADLQPRGSGTGRSVQSNQ